MSDSDRIALKPEAPPTADRDESAKEKDQPQSATGSKREASRAARAPAFVVGLLLAAIVGLTVYYLAQPQALLIQGEADATRMDISARVDGRVSARPVERGDNVTAGQLLFRIDNPELMTRLQEAKAALAVAEAKLAHIQAGTREEEIAQHKAAMDIARSNLTLSQRTYDRARELAQSGNAPVQRLDEATNTLTVAQRTADRAKQAYDEAVAGYTAEEREIAVAGVAQARASVDTIEAQVRELEIDAPVAAQVYQIGSEVGEYVAPGVPLLSLVDLNDVWLRFNLREDLVNGLKPGDKLQMRIPALGDRLITAEVKFIAPRGEYAGWRATRATGDFDLRTFEVRAAPVTPIPELRPGMSVYAEAPARK
jgi:HlyD family secretion protein